MADERHELVQLDGQIARAMDLALQLDDPAPAIAKTNALQTRRQALVANIQARAAEFEATQALAQVTERQVRQLLKQHFAELQAADADPMQLKALLNTVVERITLDPVTGACDIHYRLSADDSLLMASPRGCTSQAIFRLVVAL